MKLKPRSRRVSKVKSGKTLHGKPRRGMIRVTASAPRSEFETHMPATEAKHRFATLLENVSKGQQVFITKHNALKAVVISVEKYRSLSAAMTSLLDKLTAEFDARFERMQAPEVRVGMQRAFDATPDELAKSAVKAARQRS